MPRKIIPPTCAIVPYRDRTGLSDNDRRRIIAMREQSPDGAVEIVLRAYARPSGSNRRFAPVPSAQTTIAVFAALNAEQVIVGGPIAGRNFTATDAILELYETTYREKKK